MRIIFINAAMGEALARRAEIEHKNPAKLAGEYLARHMEEVAGKSGAGSLENGDTVGQGISVSSDAEDRLQELAQGSSVRANDIIRASINAGLQLPVSLRHLN